MNIKLRAGRDLITRSSDPLLSTAFHCTDWKPTPKALNNSPKTSYLTREDKFTLDYLREWQEAEVMFLSVKEEKKSPFCNFLWKHGTRGKAPEPLKSQASKNKIT